MKRAILIFLQCFFLAGIMNESNLESKENIYSHKFVGLNFSIPDGWYRATTEEMLEIMSIGFNEMHKSDQEQKNAISGERGKMLLMISEYPLKNNYTDYNSNISLGVVNVRNMKDEIKSGEDFLNIISVLFKDKMPNSSISEIIKQNLGGKEFCRLDVSFDDLGFSNGMMAGIHSDYLIILNLSAENEKALSELVQIADKNIRFFEVSQYVDMSSEAISFRENASLNPDKSSESSSDENDWLATGLNILSLFLVSGFILYFLKKYGNRKIQ